MDMGQRGCPPLFTPSGGHHTYGRQAGGTHPTAMLSCLLDFFVFTDFPSTKLEQRGYSQLWNIFL